MTVEGRHSLEVTKDPMLHTAQLILSLPSYHAGESVFNMQNTAVEQAR